MTITATDFYDGSVIFGNVQATLPATQTLSPFLFPVSSLIEEDLNTTNYPPDITVPYVWNTSWFVNAYIPNVLANASKFKSAVAKFDLGILAHIYRGQCTSEFFLNYASQRLQSQLCWSPDSSALYPTAYIPPSPITGDLFVLSYGGNAGPSGNYADSCIIQLTNGSLDGCAFTAYYQATLQSAETPISLGDI
jgi:hypothetical protein